MPDVANFALKPDPGPCPCGCGVEGPPRSKAWKDGLRHARPCKCSRCRGAANRRGGLRKQNVARKALGVPASKFGDANEERWQDNVFDNETKAGAQIEPVATAFLRCEKQIRQNDPDFGGMPKPARITVMPKGWGEDGIVMVRLSTWRTHIRPALNEFFGSDT